MDRPTPSTSQTAVTPNDVNDIRVQCHYMSLLDEVEGSECVNVHQNISKINEVIDKANKIFPQAKKPGQLYLDAKVLNYSCASLEDTANNLDVGEGKFNPLAFAEQLKTKSLNGEGHPSFEAFAAVAQPVVCGSLPLWAPLLSSFEYQADVTLSQQRKEKKLRAQKEQAAEKKEPEKLRSVDKTQEGIEEIIQKIYTKLKSHCKANGKKPISYLHFVINPNSFSDTVENIFHVSFLIHDGFAKIELDDDRPVIFPVSRGKENSNPGSTGSRTKEPVQNIISIDMQSWRVLIDVLDIKSAMI